MSTSTVVTLAFRCTKCWQMTCASSDQVGNSVPCCCCSTAVIVPEATPKTIEAGEEFAATSGTIAPLPVDEEMTPEEIFRIANEKVKSERATGPLEALVADRWKRFVGSVIDAFASLVAMICGVIIASIIGSEPGLPFMIVAMSVPVMFGFCQLFMIATEGRTVGKYCIKTKIVTLEGEVPGFFQGVVLRNIVVALLGMLPFFGLVDALWIFQNPNNRCLHDLIAGTMVIDALPEPVGVIENDTQAEPAEPFAETPEPAETVAAV